MNPAQTSPIAAPRSPSTALCRIAARLRAAWIAHRTRVAAQRRYTRSIADLNALDDRMLADIGVTRSDLPRLTRRRRLTIDSAAWNAFASAPIERRERLR